MTYQVLARKWRPKKFADLVGQEHVVKALVNALDKGRLHHAYLLTGTRGVGKTTIARILAKSLNCPNVQHGEPCCVCDSCQQIDAGRYVDVLEIDAASNTGIDNIREVLENAQYAPTMGHYKVYIIDEVHMLSKSAFNAMLKTLEEPPAHVKFILATTDPQKVPVTVLSRCLQFVLRNLNAQQVHDHLAHVLQTEGIPHEDAALKLLGRAATGSMRDALSLLDQAIAMGSGQVTEADVRHMIGAVDTSYLYDLLDALAAHQGQALMDKAEEMASRAIGFDSALNELAVLLQRLSLLQAVPAALAPDDPEFDHLQRLAQQFSAEQLQLYYQCALRGKADLPLAPDEYAGFLMTLLRMLAFAPMAAAAVPVGATAIGGTDLQDTPAVATAPRPKHDAAVAAAAQPKPDVLPHPQSEQISEVVHTDSVTVLAAVQDGDAAAETHAPAATDEVLPWEDAPVVENTDTAIEPEYHTEALQGVELHTAYFERPESVPVEPEAAPAALFEPVAQSQPVGAINAAVSVPETMPDGAHAAEVVQTDAVKPSAVQPSAVVLPPLTAENWPQILAALAHQLGAVQLFSLHTAVRSFDDDSGQLVLALAEQGAATASKNRLVRLGQILSAAYDRVIAVHTEAWQDAQGLETPNMRQHRLLKEQQQQAQRLLEADATAQALIDGFSATWVADSLELKDAASADK